MKSGEFWRLERLDDEALEQRLRTLLAAGSRTEAHIISHLSEVEARRLHLLQGFESLFDYCKKALGLSGNEAFYRIVAARMARQFPVIFGLIQRRELFITTLPLLRDYISQENHAELLEQVRGKSKAEVLELLATRAPRPDARSHIRRLPTTSRSVAAGPTGTLEPLSAVSYRLQLNTSHELKQKLELARDLMSHSNPSGDLAVVVERALELLIAKLQARRFGVTTRSPSNDQERSVPEEALHFERSKSEEPAGPGIPEPKRELTEKQRSARPHIPRQVRREVLARDGLQCTFTAPDGQRCSARAFLELDHEYAWARGGPNTPDNLRVLCARHNALHAEQCFGPSKMQDAIAQRRKRTG
jgi:hypothetical protein